MQCIKEENNFLEDMEVNNKKILRIIHEAKKSTSVSQEKSIPKAKYNFRTESEN